MTAAEPATIRLFLGLWPDPAAMPALTAHAEAWAWTPQARRTPADRLHVTLHFLGNVAAARLPQLRQALELSWEGCELLLDRATVWPGGIAVLEATQVPHALARLHAELGRRLQALDLPPEARPYRPHATLARKAAGSRPPEMARPLSWRCSPGYALVRSHGGGRGYETLHAYG